MSEHGRHRRQHWPDEGWHGRAPGGRDRAPGADWARGGPPRTSCNRFDDRRWRSPTGSWRQGHRHRRPRRQSPVGGSGGSQGDTHAAVTLFACRPIASTTRRAGEVHRTLSIHPGLFGPGHVAWPGDSSANDWRDADIGRRRLGCAPAGRTSRPAREFSRRRCRG